MQFKTLYFNTDNKIHIRDTEPTIIVDSIQLKANYSDDNKIDFFVLTYYDESARGIEIFLSAKDFLNLRSFIDSSLEIFDKFKDTNNPIIRIRTTSLEEKE